MFGRFGLGELLIILVIVLIIFGPKKLPEIGRSLGQAIHQFKRSAGEVEEAVSGEDEKKEDK